MKRKKTTLFFVAIALLCSCTPNQISSYEPEASTQNVSDDSFVNPYHIQKEDALRSLVQIAGQLDDQNALRSGSTSFLDRLSTITEADLRVVDNSGTLRAASTGRSEEMFYILLTLTENQVVGMPCYLPTTECQIQYCV